MSKIDTSRLSELFDEIKSFAVEQKNKPKNEGVTITSLFNNENSKEDLKVEVDEEIIDDEDVIIDEYEETESLDVVDYEQQPTTIKDDYYQFDDYEVEETEQPLVEETIEDLDTAEDKTSLRQVKRKKKKSKTNTKVKEPGKLHWYSKLCIFVDICAVICFFLAYGPIDTLRNWLVTTATNTTSHSYFAYILYSADHVERICSQYVIKQTEINTDTSAIVFNDHTNDSGVYASIYDEQVCVKDPDNDLYKIIRIKEDGYSGFITVIYEPKRLNLVISQKKVGEHISSFAKNNDALIAINAGPAKWYQGATKTLRPYNNVIADGTIINSNGEVGEIIGMNSDGILCLITCTAEEALAQNLVWGVEFGPNLIVNGVMTEFVGDGGFGTHPRTAIGQRQDGIVLLFTIDGRGGGSSKGITITKLAELAKRYGCYNAANLDGGGSTTLIEKNVLINNPVSYQHDGERNLYNSLIYK